MIGLAYLLGLVASARDQILSSLEHPENFSSVLTVSNTQLKADEYDKHILGLSLGMRRKWGLLDCSPESFPGSTWASSPELNPVGEIPHLTDFSFRNGHE